MSPISYGLKLEIEQKNLDPPPPLAFTVENAHQVTCAGFTIKSVFGLSLAIFACLLDILTNFALKSAKIVKKLKKNPKSGSAVTLSNLNSNPLKINQELFKFFHNNQKWH